jgi:uncharacterized membrane protein
MLKYAIAYGSSAVVFLGLDFIWLTFASRSFYRPQLGELLLDKPNLPIAAIFYLVYVIGVVVFAVMPGYAARSWPVALASGALLGLVAYGTYDFTNLATLKGWSTLVSLVDVAWGIVLTATAASAGYAALRMMTDNS